MLGFEELWNISKVTVFLFEAQEKSDSRVTLLFHTGLYCLKR